MTFFRPRAFGIGPSKKPRKHGAVVVVVVVGANLSASAAVRNENALHPDTAWHISAHLSNVVATASNDATRCELDPAAAMYGPSNLDA